VSPDDSLERMGAERYVSLATFRKNGDEVRTPVWIAADGGALFVYTNVTSGKVKRIRNNGEVRLAPCDMRGKVHGEWIEGRARLAEAETTRERGLRAVLRKYGWQMRIAILVSRLSGRYSERAVLEIELTSAR
jgi:PPOX class probable F420-dependent enzyme